MAETLSDVLARAVASGRTPGVTDERGTIGWSALSERAEGYAAQLAQCGVGVGGRVALWLPNSADYLALIFAVARLGAVAVHVNTRFRAHEVGTVLRRAEPSVLVTDFGFSAVDFAAVLADVSAQDRPASPRSWTGAGRCASVSVCRCCNSPHAAIRPTRRGPELACLTYTTSGTTSGPKLVLHDQRALAAHAVDVMGRLRTDAEGAVLLAAVPLCGTFGNAAAMGAVAGGAHIVCMDRFDAEVADALIRKHRVTHTVGADDMLGRLAQLAQARPHDTMRFFGFAAFGPTAAASVAWPSRPDWPRAASTGAASCRRCSPTAPTSGTSKAAASRWPPMPRSRSATPRPVSNFPTARRASSVRGDRRNS